MTPSPSNHKTHLVFIHGAWVSGWGWQKLIPYLDKACYCHHIAYLPGSESYQASLKSNAHLEDYLDYMSDLILPLEGNVWLIAHSGGGITATALAERFPNRFTGIIYIAGMMLPTGVRFDQLCEKVAGSGVNTKGIADYLIKTKYGTQVTFEGVKNIFLQDLPEAESSRVYNKMLVQPDAARKIAVNWRPENAGQVPKYYIKASQDKSLVPEVQSAMINATSTFGIAELHCGHFPQLVQPKRLAKLIEGFLTAPVEL